MDGQERRYPWPDRRVAFPTSAATASFVALLKRHVYIHTNRRVSRQYRSQPSTVSAHTVQCAWPSTSHPRINRMGRGERTYPTLLPLLPFAPPLGCVG